MLASVLLAGLTGCDAQQPWPLWEAYTQRFIDGQGRVIDRSAGDRTTSEGQAYAMFFALVDDDKAHFGKLLDWTEANLAGGDLTARLPAWSWGKTGSKRVEDPRRQFGLRCRSVACLYADGKPVACGTIPATTSWGD